MIANYMFISVERLRELRAQAKGCAICGSNYSGTLHLDHCHTTGKLRGFLCSGCNSMLGLTFERIATLEAGVAYLKFWKVAHIADGPSSQQDRARRRKMSDMRAIQEKNRRSKSPTIKRRWRKR